MVSPRKRKNSRSEKRASQRYTPPGAPGGGAGGGGGGSGGTIPRPPSTCAPFHFYWCDGHNDWHHHDEFVVTAIERTLAQGQGSGVQDTVEGADGRFRIEGLDEL